MRQRVFTRSDFGLAENETAHEDAVLDPNDPIFQIARGHEAPKRDFSQLPAWQQHNPHSERARIMRETGIKPGTPAWFALWFGKQSSQWLDACLQYLDTDTSLGAEYAQACPSTC